MLGPTLQQRGQELEASAARKPKNKTQKNTQQKLKKHTCMRS
jgi:hypothetical protein